MPSTITLPEWLLTATLNQASYALNAGRIDQDQFDAYYALWFYSAPRFAEYPFEHVRDINARLDAQ